MAEKTLKTRIQLKYDTLENWTTNSAVVLKKGEIGLVEIPSGNAAATTAPTILFKVGDGQTGFGNLKWASALAADVYAWAKKSGITIDTTGEGNFVSGISWDSKSNKISVTKGNVDLSGYVPTSRTVNGKALSTDITLGAADVGVNETNFPGLKKTGTVTSVKINGTAHNPTSGVVDLGSGFLTSHQAVKLESGTNNGTLKLTVNGTATDNIKVKGLGDLAYKSSVTKSDVGLGLVENKTLDTAVTASSGNYITSGAVKTYVDGAISGVSQFRYEVVSELPTAAKATMGKIYLKAHGHGASDSYDEFITIESGTATKTYSWEKIGNTDIDLSAYVKTLSGTANSGVLTNLTKSGNTLTVTSTSLANTAGSAETGKYVSGVTQAANGKITVTKASLPTFTDHNQTVKVGTKTFGADDAVEIAAGSNISVTADTSTKKITIGATGLATSSALADVKSTADTNKTNITGLTGRVTTLEGKKGLDKVGTVTSVAAGTGLKITGTASTTPTVGFDDDVVFVFDCGSASVNID